MTDKTEKQQPKKSTQHDASGQERPQQLNAQPKQHEKRENEEFKKDIRGIVRLAGKDIRGNIRLKHALHYIRGIGHNLSGSLVGLINRELGISPEILIGELSEGQVEKIDHILFNTHQYKIPTFMINRRADVFDGVNKHVIMNDLLFSTSQDIEREKKSYTWKGFRHAYGQKVRGQRTRNTGRSGMAVGVLRKAIMQQQKEAAAAKGGERAPAAGGAASAAKPAAPAGAPKKAGGPATPAGKPEEKKK